MNNLVNFTLFVWMAYTVYAESPYLSSPYYYHKHDILPVLQQNANQYELHRDAIMSVMLREWKETNVIVQNVRKEVTDLKHELAQLKKSNEEIIERNNLKKNETKIQTEMLPTEFEPFTFDYGNKARNPSARYCGCRTFHDIFNYMSKDLDDTKSLLKAITSNINNDLAAMDAKFTGITGQISQNLDDTDDKFDGITTATNTALGAMDDKFGGITTATNNALGATNNALNALNTQFTDSLLPTSIDKQPNSCADLIQLGYKKSGIFSIKANNQVKSVYCDFKKSAPGLQKLIGIVDVKTIRVSFHAQLNGPFITASATVIFNKIVTNEGEALSTTSGIFTAPVAGTYFFAFVGLSVTQTEARVELQKKTVGGTFLSVGRAFGSDYEKETFAMDAILVLKKDDEIRVFLFEGKIHDSETHNTNFVGFLIEEEKV